MKKAHMQCGCREYHDDAIDLHCSGCTVKYGLLHRLAKVLKDNVLSTLQGQLGTFAWAAPEASHVTAIQSCLGHALGKLVCHLATHAPSCTTCREYICTSLTVLTLVACTNSHTPHLTHAVLT